MTYGTCEAEMTPVLEALLGLCRMLGYRYEINKRPVNHQEVWWSVHLQSILPDPADFYHRPRKPEEMGKMLTRGYTVICIRNEADIPGSVQSAICGMVGSYRDNCEHWRRMASENPAYKDWPQFRSTP